MTLEPLPAGLEALYADLQRALRGIKTPDAIVPITDAELDAEFFNAEPQA